MPIRATTVGVGLALAAVVNCSSPAPPPPETVKLVPIPAAVASPAPSPVLGYTEQRLLATDTALDPPAYPIRTNSDGSWLVVGANDWTAGFYAAALWRTYERTRDPAWRQRAQTWQAGLASETTHDSTDLGFKIFDTFGVA
jgi:unsaturated chondroitin disaccharide hydrolase